MTLLRNRLEQILGGDDLTITTFLRWLKDQGVDVQALSRSRRNTPVVHAVALILHKWGYPALRIGQVLGRDHTTILAALRKPNPRAAQVAAEIETVWEMAQKKRKGGGK